MNKKNARIQGAKAKSYDISTLFSNYEAVNKLSYRSYQWQPTVAACSKIIAETIGKLPAYLYQTSPKGDEIIHRHQSLNVLTRWPNDVQTMQTFLEMVGYHLCYAGNFYAVITRFNDEIIELLPIENPHNVQPKIVGGKLVYKLVVNPNLQKTSGYKTEYSKDEILHIRAAGPDLVKGIGCVELARNSIELSAIHEKHARSFSEKAGVPAGVITPKDNVTYSADQMDAILDTLEETIAGPNASGSIAFIPGGVDWKSVSLNHKDAQFLEQRQYSRSEICSIFRVPEHFLDGAANVKYSNYGQSMLSFYTETISPFIKRIQEAFDRQLAPLNIRFKLDESELTRGDTATRQTNMMALYNAGIITLNEARLDLGYTLDDDGDRYKLQNNNENIGTIAEHLENQAQESTATNTETDNNNNNEVEDDPTKEPTDPQKEKLPVQRN